MSCFVCSGSACPVQLMRSTQVFCAISGVAYKKNSLVQFGFDDKENAQAKTHGRNSFGFFSVLLVRSRLGIVLLCYMTISNQPPPSPPPP